MGAAGYGIDRWLHIVYITWGDTVVVYIWCLRLSKDRAYDCGYFLMNNVAVRVENLSKLYRIGVYHYRAGISKKQQEKRRSELLSNLPIYSEKFKFLKASTYLSFGWRRKMRKALLNLVFFSSSKKSIWFGLDERDQTNLLKGRFIRLSDPLENLFHPYYLAQRIPRKFLLSPSNPYRHLVRKAGNQE